MICRFSSRPALVGLVAGLLAVLGTAPCRAAAPVVTVSRPVQTVVTDTEDFTGRAEPVQKVDLRARVTGYVLQVHFKEGARVKKGDLLLEIDPRPYQTDLDQAQAGLAVAEAQLKSRDAAFRRAQALFKNRMIAKEELDKAAADLAESAAMVKLAQAKLTHARLLLSFTKVTAPIDGKISRPLVTPGNLAVADTTVLAAIVSTDPMMVSFDIDERTLLRYRRQLRAQKTKEDRPSVAIGVADETGYPHKGIFDGLAIQIDPATGTIRARAVVPNTDGLLLPGMSVRVRMPIGKPRAVLLVPANAIFSMDGKQLLLLVNDKNVVERREVKVGKSHNGMEIIEAGLKLDERVVVSGPKRLRPGDKVEPRPEPARPAKD
jgi:RND family efflux transporter MFP subunit